MTFAAFLEVLTAFFKFPDSVLALVRVLGKTPEQKHQDLVKAISDEAQKFQDTGRPTW